MQHARIRENDGYWTNLPALTRVERLEAACHRVILSPGGEEERTSLRALLMLGLGKGFDPFSPAAPLAEEAGEKISGVAAILNQEKPNILAMCVAVARLCQTLTNLRGHLGGGRRLIGASPLAPRPEGH